MKACAFDFARPKDVAEALSLLSNENAKAAAGTQSLGPMLNLRVVQPALLVDLRSIPELLSVSENRESVTFGACVTHAEIEDGRVPDPSRGFMREVAANIAYRAVRNRGTLGGSLAHADPAADWPSAMTALGAVAVIAGAEGRREVPMERFLKGLFETDLQPGELLVAVRVSKLSAKAKTGYWKFCRKAGEFAQAIGAAVSDPESGTARAVMGATGSSPFVVPDAEGLFKQRKTEAVADAAGLGGDAYNRQLHAVALRRAIERMAA
jgi:aerobic carbon-monoxide dehydrogenase medium subunit